MGEYRGTTLRVGGKISGQDGFLNDLADAIEELYGPSDCGNASDVEGGLLEAIERNEPAVFNAERNYGDMSEIRAWLQEHGVAYTAHCDANYEYNATLAAWQPGWDSERETESNQDGKVVVSLSELLARAESFCGDLAEELLPIEAGPPPLEQSAQLAKATETAS